MEVNTCEFFPPLDSESLFFFLFVYLEFIVPLKIFHSYGDVTIAGEGLQIFYLCSALMAIEQWGFFNVPHLLWHWHTLYNGHLRGPVTLTPVAERLAGELSLPVFMTVFVNSLFYFMKWSDRKLSTSRLCPNTKCDLIFVVATT